MGANKGKIGRDNKSKKRAAYYVNKIPLKNKIRRLIRHLKKVGNDLVAKRVLNKLKK